MPTVPWFTGFEPQDNPISLSPDSNCVDSLETDFRSTYGAIGDGQFLSESGLPAAARSDRLCFLDTPVVVPHSTFSQFLHKLFFTPCFYFPDKAYSQPEESRAPWPSPFSACPE